MMNIPKLMSAARPPLLPRKKKAPSSSTSGASHRLAHNETQIVEGIKPRSPREASHPSSITGRPSSTPALLSPYAAVMPSRGNAIVRRAGSLNTAAARTSLQAQKCISSHSSGFGNVVSVGKDAMGKRCKFADIDRIEEPSVEEDSAGKLRNFGNVDITGEGVAHRTGTKRRNIDDREDAAMHVAAKRCNKTFVAYAAGDIFQRIAARGCNIVDVANGGEDAIINTSDSAAPYTATKRRYIADVAYAGECVPPHTTAKRRRVTGTADISGLLLPNTPKSLPRFGVTKVAPTSSANIREHGPAAHEMMAAKAAATSASAKDCATPGLVILGEGRGGIVALKLDEIAHQMSNTYSVALLAAESRCTRKRILDAIESERLTKRACVNTGGFATNAHIIIYNEIESTETQSKRQRKRSHETSEESLRKRCKGVKFPTGRLFDPVAVC